MMQLGPNSYQFEAEGVVALTTKGEEYKAKGYY